MTNLTPFVNSPVVQTNQLGYRPGRDVVFTGGTIYIPKTRPSIRYPITEYLAAKHKMNLWYFDPNKWPDRIPVDPAEYLGIKWTSNG